MEKNTESVTSCAQCFALRLTHGKTRVLDETTNELSIAGEEENEGFAFPGQKSNTRQETRGRSSLPENKRISTR